MKHIARSHLQNLNGQMCNWWTDSEVPPPSPFPLGVGGIYDMLLTGWVLQRQWDVISIVMLLLKILFCQQASSRDSLPSRLWGSKWSRCWSPHGQVLMAASEDWGKLTAHSQKAIGALSPTAAKKWVLPSTGMSSEMGSSPVKPPDEHAACETPSRGRSCAWVLSTELWDNECVLLPAAKFVVICYIEMVNYYCNFVSFFFLIYKSRGNHIKRLNMHSLMNFMYTCVTITQIKA